jgi:hypothetical protein
MTSTPEAEAGPSRDPDQPGLHNETPAQNTKQTKFHFAIVLLTIFQVRIMSG